MLKSPESKALEQIFRLHIDGRIEELEVARDVNPKCRICQIVRRAIGHERANQIEEEQSELHRSDLGPGLN